MEAYYAFQYSLCRVVLMVIVHPDQTVLLAHFQYSLCRVVLMVIDRTGKYRGTYVFQYSLCRVVLMVSVMRYFTMLLLLLSVLALSSRFDGQPANLSNNINIKLSVLALSSRFDGPAMRTSSSTCSIYFQYSLCRVVLMVLRYYGAIMTPGKTFSTRSVESF